MKPIKPKYNDSLESRLSRNIADEYGLNRIYVLDVLETFNQLYKNKYNPDKNYYMLSAGLISSYQRGKK